MAKKRRVKTAPPPAKQPANAEVESQRRESPALSNQSEQPNRLEPTAIAAALLAGALVYVTYHPSDSVSVEHGNALWFAMIAIAIATLALARFAFLGRFAGRSQRLSVAVDSLAIGLAIWIMISAFATCPPGNLRMATNEAWLWISGAAVFCASRRLMVSLAVRRAIIALIVACSTGVAVHGLHQQWYSLPQSRAEYRSDPDKLLAAAQIVAPPGSVERMIFENRLFDGGPTGTFALANSLAGMLIVGCVLAAGLMWSQWRTMQRQERIVWPIALAIGLTCLWMARSRSATLACAIGIIAVILGVSLFAGDRRGISAAGRDARRKMLRLVFVGVSSLAVVVAGLISLIAAVGNKEWFEQAPASLAFRFQYWRSTWAIALDAPWFGAGPGNFQSIYQRYREQSASEDVADAHNFLFETLAAGGFVAVILLLALIAATLLFIRHNVADQTDQDSSDENSDDLAKWVWLGGGLSLLMVWLIGAAAGRTPDFQAHMFAVPIACAVAVFIWSTVRRCSSVGIDLIAGGALVSLMIHLLAAGGWTIPGVAMLIWLIAGMLCRTENSLLPDDVASEKAPGDEPGKAEVRRWKPAIAIVVAGLGLLFIFRSVSLEPAEAADRAMQAADFARSQRQLAAMNRAVQRAVEADPWSPDASLYKSDLLHWELIARGENDSLRQQWLEQLNETLRRAGENPAIYRSAGQQALHLYQRFGNRDDLVLADNWLVQAASWSPADHALAAQRAAVAHEMGQDGPARQLAQTAAALAKIGNNIERQLSRQMIYVVSPIGSAAVNGPTIRPADEVLGDRIFGLQE